jgi:hypothetical protein
LIRFSGSIAGKQGKRGAQLSKVNRSNRSMPCFVRVADQTVQWFDWLTMSGSNFRSFLR